MVRVDLVVVALLMTTISGCVAVGPGEIGLQAGDETSSCAGSACTQHVAENESELSVPPPVHTFEVAVLDVRDGSPIEGAAVFLLDSTRAQSRNTFIVPVLFFPVAFITAETYGAPVATANTDASGVARFDVPPGMPAAFVAGGPNTTVEGIEHVFAGPDQETTELAIIVYPDAVQLTMDSAPEQVAAGPIGPVLVDEIPVRFDAGVDDEDLHLAYLQRIEELHVELAWENDALQPQWADVYGALRANDGVAWVGADNENWQTPGAHNESVHVWWSDLWAAREEMSTLSIETWTDNFEGHLDMKIQYTLDVQLRGVDYEITF